MKFTGDRIATLRKEKKLTQEELSIQLDVTRQSISKWESGVAIPEYDKLLKLSDIFSCSIDYLLNENMNNKEINFNEITPYSVGEKIFSLRKTNNVTQEQLAEVLGVTRQTIYKWEVGLSTPEIYKIIMISDFFSCSLDYLIRNKNVDDNIVSINDRENIVNETKMLEVKIKESGKKNNLLIHGSSVLMTIIAALYLIISKKIIIVTNTSWPFLGIFIIVLVGLTFKMLSIHLVSFVTKNKKMYISELLMFLYSIIIFSPFIFDELTNIFNESDYSFKSYLGMSGLILFFSYLRFIFKVKKINIYNILDFILLLNVGIFPFILITINNSLYQVALTIIFIISFTFLVIINFIELIKNYKKYKTILISMGISILYYCFNYFFIDPSFEYQSNHMYVMLIIISVFAIVNLFIKHKVINRSIEIFIRCILLVFIVQTPIILIAKLSNDLLDNFIQSINVAEMVLLALITILLNIGKEVKLYEKN